MTPREASPDVREIAVVAFAQTDHRRTSGPTASTVPAYSSPGIS